MTATVNWHGPSSQKGAALIVSMIMLLVITAIGVAVMTGSHLELMMSNNSQLQSSSYMNAEVVLADGEAIMPPSTPPSPLTTDPSNIANWANNTLNPAPTPVTLGGSVIGSYEIEYLGHNSYSAPNTYKDSTSSCPPRDICLDVYRVWAYGTDAKGAKTLLQETFMYATDTTSIPSTYTSKYTVEMP